MKNCCHNFETVEIKYYLDDIRFSKKITMCTICHTIYDYRESDAECGHVFITPYVLHVCHTCFKKSKTKTIINII